MTSWLDRIRPGINRIFQKRDTPDNLWVKDPDTGAMLFKADLEAAQWVTPSGKHMRIGASLRLKYLFDGETWETIPQPQVAQDPLKFKDDKPYIARLKDARHKNGTEDCMSIGAGRILGQKAVVIVQDFAFMGGSLGMAAGEAFVKAAEEAVARGAA